MVRCGAIAAGMGALVLGLLTAIDARAQQSSCQVRTIPITVLGFAAASANAHPPIGLEASYRGKKVRVDSVSPLPAEQPRTMLLVDISESMRGERSKIDWDFSLDVAENLLSNMPQSVAIGIAFFTTDLQHVIKPTLDHETLRDEVEVVRKTRLEMGPLQTGLWDAIQHATGLLDHPQVGDAMYVITDGLDNKSKTEAESMAQRLMVQGVRLFTFVFAEKMNNDYGESLERDKLQQIAEDSGGEQIVMLRPSHYLFYTNLLADRSGNPTELALDLAAQYKQILNVFGLTIELP